MSETTLQRADEWLREQLAVEPPIPVKLADGDQLFGTFVRTEERTTTDEDGTERQYEVAVFGEANLDDVTTVPKGFDGDQLIEYSLSGVNLRRQWDEQQPRPGERVGIRRLWESRTSKGQPVVIYNLAIHRLNATGDDAPLPDAPLPDDDYDE
jgi:hypothetical protein